MSLDFVPDLADADVPVVPPAPVTLHVPVQLVLQLTEAAALADCSFNEFCVRALSRTTALDTPHLEGGTDAGPVAQEERVDRHPR